VCAPNAGALADAMELMVTRARAGDGAQADEHWLAAYEWDAIAESVAGALA
jgi:hypothetical protein